MEILWITIVKFFLKIDNLIFFYISYFLNDDGDVRDDDVLHIADSSSFVNSSFVDSSFADSSFADSSFADSSFVDSSFASSCCN